MHNASMVDNARNTCIETSQLTILVLHGIEPIQFTLIPFIYASIGSPFTVPVHVHLHLMTTATDPILKEYAKHCIISLYDRKCRLDYSYYGGKPQSLAAAKVLHERGKKLLIEFGTFAGQTLPWSM